MAPAIAAEYGTVAAVGMEAVGACGEGTGGTGGGAARSPGMDDWGGGCEEGEEDQGEGEGEGEWE